MDYKEAKKRLLAAQTLLLEPSSSFEKFAAVHEILLGVHPELDRALERAEQDLDALEKILGLDFFSFATENLPELTEEQRKRKKAALVFWKVWNELRGEVSRVQTEMQAANNSSDQVVKRGHWARIFNFAKGPFGILTIVAVALVVASSATSVQIIIHNQGCPTMIPSGSVPNFIPGISFPTAPIPSGGEAKASIPGLPITIDGSKKGMLVVSSLKFHMTFELGTVTDITFDGAELQGHSTDVNLSAKKTHDLVFICS